MFTKYTGYCIKPWKKYRINLQHPATFTIKKKGVEESSRLDFAFLQLINEICTLES